MAKSQVQFTKDLIWEMIKMFNTKHSDYGMVVKFLANFADEIDKEPKLTVNLLYEKEQI